MGAGVGFVCQLELTILHVHLHKLNLHIMIMYAKVLFDSKIFVFTHPARSPVYSHISSTLQGLPIIRTFGKTAVSIEQFHYYQNEHTRVRFTPILLHL